MIKEKILAIIKENPIKKDKLINNLKITKKELSEFEKILNELEKDGKIFITKKEKIIYVDNKRYFYGKVQTSSKGFGFVITENLDDDIFISQDDLNSALNGDEVIVKLYPKSDGKSPEGAVVNILKRANQKIVGIFQNAKNFGFVVPDEAKFGMDIYIPKKRFNGAKDGQKVFVKINKYPKEGKKPEGTIVEVLGYPDEPGVDVLSIARNLDIPMEFSKSVKREAKNIPQKIDQNEIKNRVDLRDKITFTIDGADSKDFDDAVSLEMLENGNYLLGVHIADVAHYVKFDSAIDDEAYKRGNSVYLLDQVIPMLPFELSNGICSLNEGVDRLTLSCDMEVDGKGNVLNSKVYESVIKSNRRLVYEDVSNFLENEVVDKSIEGLEEILKNMYELSKILQEKRTKNGAIDFDIPEAVIKVSDKGWPIEILKRDRRSANKLIEDFMLLANVVAAETFHEREIPFVYRIHERPLDEKISQLNSYIRPLNLQVNFHEEVKPMDIQKLMEKVHGTKEEYFVSTLALRAMQKARYSDEDDIHFGLSFRYYTHFTSPIRRYSDLIVHRIIKDYLHGGLSKSKIKFLNKNLPEMTEHISRTEKISQEAERQVESRKMAEYMSEKIGESFCGIVSGITNYGIYVQLDNLIEGLVAYKSMDGYFEFDEITYRAVSDETKEEYKVGDSVKIKVSNVNLNLGTIDFVLVGDKIEEE